MTCQQQIQWHIFGQRERAMEATISVPVLFVGINPPQTGEEYRWNDVPPRARHELYSERRIW